MRIKVDAGNLGPALFLTSANLPTQIAYGLTYGDVVDAFLVSLVASQRVLLAASYFFESLSTRKLVESFPNIFHEQQAIFFVNVGYPTFVDHGLGKVAKSPNSFDPYADARLVRKRGRILDSFNVIGTRSDFDISEALVRGWLASCLSTDPDSIASLIHRHVPPEFVELEIVRCTNLTRGGYDFVWPAIESQVLQSPRLAPLAPALRRKLADLYAQVTSIRLGASETTPAIGIEGPVVSDRSIGHLGTFQRLLQLLGLDIRRLQADPLALSSLLKSPELEAIRRAHTLIISTAVTLNDDVLSYWRGLEMVERRSTARRLSHHKLIAALTSTFRALDLDTDTNFVERLSDFEASFDNKFVSQLRIALETTMLESDAPTTARKSASPSGRIIEMPKDKLLFVSADPGGSGLALDKERKKIRHAIAGLGPTATLEFEDESALEKDDLQAVIMRTNPRFFHFSGHGTTGGDVLVEGKGVPLKKGKSGDFLRISAVTNLLKLISKNIHCVVFNSCYSESAIAEIGSKIEYAILMSDKIGDEAALRFAEGFYRSVGSGEKVRPSFEAGCAMMDIHDTGYTMLPQLYRYGRLVKRRS